MKTPPLLLLAVALVAPALLSAADEYTFDLNKPPEYAREWFALVAKEEAAQAAGPAKGLVLENLLRLENTPPRSGASAERWAAYRWAQMRLSLSRMPNFVYLKRIRTEAKEDKELEPLMWLWSHTDIQSGSTIRTLHNWMLGRPDVDSKTKPEEVKKLNRYIARLAAQVYRKFNDAFDPEHMKTFHCEPMVDRSRIPPYIVIDAKEKEALRIARRDELWNDRMIRIHANLESGLHFLKCELCLVFRSHLPGDKESIREMLAEAGFKTSAQRRQFWQYCRTTGAHWSMWESADEDRLVTD